MDMFYSLFTILAHVLSWLFVIGMVGTVLLVIPVAAYQLFSVLFQKDHPCRMSGRENYRCDDMQGEVAFPGVAADRKPPRESKNVGS